jgi:hypothetical protein
VYGGLLQAGVGYLLLGVFGAVLQRDLASGNALKTLLVLAFTVVGIVVFGWVATTLDERARRLLLGAEAHAAAARLVFRTRRLVRRRPRPHPPQGLAVPTLMPTLPTASPLSARWR